MMLLARVLLVEFGVFVAALILLLAWQVGRGFWGQRRRFFIDEWALAAGGTGTCGAYVVELVRAGGERVPSVPVGWVAGFGACCGLHVVMKTIRIVMKR